MGTLGHYTILPASLRQVSAYVKFDWWRWPRRKNGRKGRAIYQERRSKKRAQCPLLLSRRLKGKQQFPAGVVNDENLRTKGQPPASNAGRKLRQCFGLLPQASANIGFIARPMAILQSNDYCSLEMWRLSWIPGILANAVWNFTSKLWFYAACTCGLDIWKGNVSLKCQTNARHFLGEWIIAIVQERALFHLSRNNTLESGPTLSKQMFPCRPYTKTGKYDGLIQLTAAKPDAFIRFHHIHTE